MGTHSQKNLSATLSKVCLADMIAYINSYCQPAILDKVQRLADCASR